MVTYSKQVSNRCLLAFVFLLIKQRLVFPSRSVYIYIFSEEFWGHSLSEHTFSPHNSLSRWSLFKPTNQSSAARKGSHFKACVCLTVILSGCREHSECAIEYMCVCVCWQKSPISVCFCVCPQAWVCAVIYACEMLSTGYEFQLWSLVYFHYMNR